MSQPERPRLSETAQQGFFIIDHNLPEVPVERTPLNDHLLWHNPSTQRFEVIKQGSAIVVNLLRIHEAVERRLALFDNRAVFHDDLLLTSVELLETRGGPKGPAKHMAHFEPDYSMAIDNIYCLNLAKPKPQQDGSLMLVQLHLEEFPKPSDAL